MKAPSRAEQRCRLRADFLEDGFGGGDGVGGFEDGAADDEEVGAGLGGFGGGHDAGLVVGFGVAGADAGGDELDVRRQDGAERGDLERGADETAQAALGGEAAEADDLFFGGIGDAGFGEAGGAHRGEDGDAEEEEVGLLLLLGLDGPLQHLAATAGVEREHADGELGGGLDCFGDGVGDVVELEVEEDVEAQVGDFADGVGAAGSIHFEANLDPADGALELAEGGSDVARGLGVEDEDQITGH